jgi:hypothetical protein
MLKKRLRNWRKSIRSLDIAEGQNSNNTMLCPPTRGVLLTAARAHPAMVPAPAGPADAAGPVPFKVGLFHNYLLVEWRKY